MPNNTWILNATLLTQDARRRVFKANLCINSSGQIEKVTTRSPARGKVRTIDASGLIIVPGFVQAHIHLCQTLFRNRADDLELLDWLKLRIWPMEAAHTWETLNVSALLGIHELLSSGTTCILDMGTVRHTEAIFEAVKKTGIRASVGKCLMDHPKHNPKNLQEGTWQALSEAKSLYRKWNGAENGRIRVSYAPRFAISCTEELLREVGELSRGQGALIHTHASENQKEIAWVKKLTGFENIRYLEKLGLMSKRTVIAHGVWLSKREKSIFKKTGASIAHCPSSNLKLASGIAPVPELRRMGVNVALGADGAPCNNNLNALQEMRLAALIQKPMHGPRAMKTQEVFDMATRDGAKALNWFDEIGSIEEGKRADLAAFDLEQVENFSNGKDLVSSLVYASQPAHLRWTMVDGKVVFTQNKGVTGLNKAALLKRARAAQRLIAERS